MSTLSSKLTTANFTFRMSHLNQQQRLVSPVPAIPNTSAPSSALLTRRKEKPPKQHCRTLSRGRMPRKRALPRGFARSLSSLSRTHTHSQPLDLNKKTSRINCVWVEKRLEYHLTSSIRISLDIRIGVKSCMGEVNFRNSASICAIQTSNPSDIQVPQLRNTFDLSTNSLPLVLLK